jgi:hypothetical protein
VAHKTTFKVRGEQGGVLFVDPSLKPGTSVVTEGRAVLADNDAVMPKSIAFDAATEATGTKGPPK